MCVCVCVCVCLCCTCCRQSRCGMHGVRITVDIRICSITWLLPLPWRVNIPPCNNTCYLPGMVWGKIFDTCICGVTLSLPFPWRETLLWHRTPATIRASCQAWCEGHIWLMHMWHHLVLAVSLAWNTTVTLTPCNNTCFLPGMAPGARIAMFDMQNSNTATESADAMRPPNVRWCFWN
jgi:hypothetical protein